MHYRFNTLNGLLDNGCHFELCTLLLVIKPHLL